MNQLLLARSVSTMPNLRQATFFCAMMTPFCDPDISEAAPRIVGDQTVHECQVALGMADQAFKGTGPHLYWPNVEPSSFADQVALDRSALDISGGDGIAFDSNVFERNPDSAEYPSSVIYSQTTERLGVQLVVHASSFSWRGDRYRTFTAPSTLSPERIRSDERGSHSIVEVDYILGENQWSPPTVLINQAGELWILDKANTFNTGLEWSVFVFDDGRYSSPCKIDFAMGNERGLDLLPKDIQTFAELLDEALGSGRNEGTLQPTARIRNEIIQTWNNVALRPWVTIKEPYNTRLQVEQGLQTWSEMSPRHAAVYREIKDIYRSAETALAEFFQSQHGYTKDGAVALSSKTMDLVYRRHFVFGK